MNFKRWLFEVRHVLFDEPPLPLHIDGRPVPVTGIDFKFEDYGQTKYAMANFVQEFLPGVADGYVFVNMGWDGYWHQKIDAADLHKQIFGDAKTKSLVFDQPSGPGQPKLEVNPLDRFGHIDPDTLPPDADGPARIRPPYDKKPTLSWWDFAEVTVGNTVVKEPARIR